MAIRYNYGYKVAMLINYSDAYKMLCGDASISVFLLDKFVKTSRVYKLCDLCKCDFYVSSYM